MWNSTKTFKEIYSREHNSFDLLRIIFALMVIYSHSYALLNIPNHTADIVLRVTKVIDAGSIAVFSFFILSGFLITQSIENSAGYVDYFKKRMLRIIPAFLVSLVITSFIIGPIFTKMSALEYLTSTGPWKYVFDNITFTLGEKYINTPNDLFADAPFPGDGTGAANGSSWTLRFEVAGYIMLIALSFFLFLRFRVMMLVFTALIGLCHILYMKYQFTPVQLPVKYFWVLGSFEMPHFFRFIFYYCMGSVLYLYRDKIIYSHRFLLLGFALMAIAIKINQFNYWLMFLLPYLVIGIGINFSFKKFKLIGDPSYGLYIYAWPIQQTIVMLTHNNISVYGLFFTAGSITFIVSMLSWRYIEKPMLKFKKSIPPLLVGKKVLNGNHSTNIR